MSEQTTCFVTIEDLGDRRLVHIDGPHMDKGILRQVSTFETRYSQALLERIQSLKGCMYLKDEISRDIDPDYVMAPLKNTIAPVTTLNEKAVLDFGSGGGASAINLCRLGATNIHGVDIDAGLVDMAIMRANEYGLEKTIAFHHVEDTTHLPLESEFFDVVVCSAVLEHIRPGDREAHLVELWRVLKRGGHLFIMGTPNRLWPIDGHTTGLPLVPYMPLKLARPFSIRFSDLVTEEDSIDDLLVKGIRGCSYWEIHAMLPGSMPVLAADIEKHFSMSAKAEDSSIKKRMRRARVVFYNLVDKSVCKLINVPVGAFYPYISLCFRKEI